MPIRFDPEQHAGERNHYATRTRKDSSTESQVGQSRPTNRTSFVESVEDFLESDALRSSGVDHLVVHWSALAGVM